MIFLSEWESQSDLTREEKNFLSALFSDETEAYRTPAEPEAGDTIRIRLRTERSSDCRAWLVTGSGTELIPMRIVREDAYFFWHEAELVCPEQPVSYCFLAELGSRGFLCRRFGAEPLKKGGAIDFSGSFRITPGFHTPAWAKGALQYQIFVDRFRNGSAANDVLDAEYCYADAPVQRIEDWGKPPNGNDFRCFYGGDLQGVAEKLDYLQDLGVEVIYFNPIFLSPSSHKYDAQDYEHVDPHFAVIRPEPDCTHESAHADPSDMECYTRRVTSPENLEESNRLFARLCGEIHRRGMRIILDGVFNHCGSFHRWMDREGIYARTGETTPGAWQSPESPYRRYFNFSKKFPDGYEAWWGVPTLAKLNYEASPELCERIFEIACRWASPPYSIDGWRLDVAADVGHSPTFNHAFWQEFRRRLKAVNPELLILAEHYGDPSAWLRGDQWDSVMNYDAFMEPMSYFLTGMEKHSDQRRDELYQNGRLFLKRMRETMSRMDWSSLQCAMNELSNHDHSRFLTRTNRTVGRLDTMGPEAAEQGVDKRVLREAVVMQMTWPGAPTIYYGDEAGLTGWTDPDNRRGYPWGREDQSLIGLHQRLAALRREHPVLRHGSFKALDAGGGWVAYARFDDADCAVTVCNNGNEAIYAPLRLRDAGAREDESFSVALLTGEDGWSDEVRRVGTVKNGKLQLFVPAHSAMLLVRSGM